MIKKIAVAKMMVAIMGVSALMAQGKISGYMFGDYYYVLSHHNEDYKGQNGFWFRRIYFTYDYDISKNFSTRIRFELNSPDFTKFPSILIPYIKDAYLKYKLNHFDIFLGISPTPTWEFIEKFFEYRHIEKTPLDLFKMGDSRDFGVALSGKIKFMKYHIMFGNSSGTKSENDKFKQFLGSLNFDFNPFVIEIYGDIKERKEPIYTFQAFSGIDIKKFKLGIQLANQIKDKKDDKDEDIKVISGFSIFNLTERIRYILRYDKLFEKAPKDISYTPFAQAKTNFLISGIDFKIHENVNLIPNLKYAFYEKDPDTGVEYKSDTYLNVTFFYKF